MPEATGFAATVCHVPLAAGGASQTELAKVRAIAAALPPEVWRLQLPRMPLFAHLRLWIANGLIAAILAVITIDAMPLAPPPLKDAVQPVAQRVGLGQHWNVFTPPDGVNTRLRAEITYADGKTATWRSPNWPDVPLWRRFTGHRHEEFWDTAWGQEDEPVWPSWAKHLARTMRRGEPDAWHGAEVKIIVEEEHVRSPEFTPWETWRTRPKFEDQWTLTIEKVP